MNKFITIFSSQKIYHTIIHEIGENEWEFACFSPPVSEICKTIKESVKIHEKYYDSYIQNAPYSTLDRVGLQSYIDALEKFMESKPEQATLDIQWKTNPANVKFQVKYDANGKYRDYEKNVIVLSPIYRITPYFKNKYSKYFAYNPEDPMHDDRPEFSPEGSYGLQINVLKEDLEQYIKDLKAEL